MRGLPSTILLVLALAGLGGYIYFVELKKPATTPDSKPKAFATTAEEIEELQIAVADGDTTVARRAGAGWTLVQPIEAEGDASELSNMASSLASLDVQRVVDENPGDVAQYGLNPPKVEVAFRVKGQAEPLRLQIGDKTPTGGDVYARRPGEPRVFLVSSFLEDTFRRSAFDLRDKTILKFDRDKVDGLEIALKGTTMQFARKGTDWTIVKPSVMRADYAAIEGLITSLSATLMQKFVAPSATPAELQQYGLDRPTISVAILMGSARASLQLGRTVNAETYARDAAKPAILMVAPTIVADLGKELAEYRRKELFDMRAFSTSRIELKRGAETFVFEKSSKDGKDTWRDAAGKDVDTMKVDDLLTKLSNIRAQSFEPGANPALRTPAITVNVSFGDTPAAIRMETVVLARTAAGGVASRPDEPGSAVLDAPALNDISAALDGLK